MLAGLPRPRGQPVELFDIGKPCLRISVVQFGHHEGTVAPLRPAGYRDSLVDVPLGGQARSGSSRQPAGRWRPAQAGVPRKWLVVSTDIANRGFGTPGVDFLTCRKVRNGCRSLVTNPPYGDSGSHKGQTKSDGATPWRSRLPCRASLRCWSVCNGSPGGAPLTCCPPVRLQPRSY